LQARQSQPVAQYAHCFHALDRLKIAERLSSQLLAFGRDLPVFIQINASGEASKSGFMCDRWQDKPQQAEELLTAIKRIAALPKLQVVGLMTMAPFEATEAQLRATFQRMKGLSDYLTNHLPALSTQQLSMGMSNDFEIAIAAGATHVRIGSAIFGHRTQ
jgi:pyridoxal phosphate enzyme (YggS family)